MKKFLVALGLLMLPLAYAGLTLWQDMSRINSDDPGVWESVIAGFEDQDKANPPPPGAVLFVGSSSIRLWDTLAQDMAPMAVIQRGFGGARMGDVLAYADRIVLPYKARAVVIFVGSNDINVAETPEQAMQAVPVIAKGFQALVRGIEKNQPGTDIFWIDITPTPLSWNKIRAVDAANNAARRICDSRSRVHCLHTRQAFISESGEPDETLFIFDGLHLNEDGYAIWTSIIKPGLLAVLAQRA